MRATRQYVAPGYRRGLGASICGWRDHIRTSSPSTSPSGLPARFRSSVPTRQRRTYARVSQAP